MIQLLYILFCILFANLNAYLIEKGKRIYHALNGLIHLAIYLFVGFKVSWLMAVIMVLEGRVAFDLMLNIFRKLPLDYVPKNPKAITDIIEKWIFKDDGFLPKAIYILVAIVVNVLIGFKVINW